jgi:hypothetical protein
MRPLKPRVNVICLVGAVLAVLSLFLPWAVIQNQETLEKTNLGALDFGKTFLGIHLFDGNGNFELSVTIFIIGAAVAFLSPLGGILQLIGAMGFVFTTLTWGVEGFKMIFYIGAAVGLISAALVLLSLAWPTGVGYDTRREGIGISRLLTFSAYR